MMHFRRQQKVDRRNGAVLVEFALVSSLFAMFLAMILELGHVYIIINALNAAAKRGARYGVVEGVSTAQVIAKANSYLGASLNPAEATITVRDASVFDTNGYDGDSYDHSTLPTIELLDAETRQLFAVRVSVPYDDVALIPPFWIKGVTLVGQSVTRHE